MTFRLAVSPRVSILIGLGLTAISITVIAFNQTQASIQNNSTQAQLFPGVEIPERRIPQEPNTPPPSIDLEQSIPLPETIEKEHLLKAEQKESPLPPPPVVAQVPEESPSNQIQILECNGISPASANLRIGPGDRQIGVIVHSEFVQMIGNKSGDYYPVRAKNYWVGSQHIQAPIEGWIHQCFLD